MTPEFDSAVHEYNVSIGYSGIDVDVVPTDSRALVGFSVVKSGVTMPIDPVAINGWHLHLDGQMALTIDGVTGVDAPYTLTIWAGDGAEQGTAYVLNVAYYGPEDD